jgi:hypothetical protein
MAPSSRMKRSTRKLTVFAVVVMALIAAAWWQVRSDQQSAPGTLTSLKPDTITRVNLKIGNASIEHYVKRDNHWWRVDQPEPERADDLRLGELVNIAAAPVESWQPTRAYDLAKIGLSPPQARLEVDDQTILFGGMTAIGQNAYAQVGDRVGIISLRYMPRSAQSDNIKAF